MWRCTWTFTRLKVSYTLIPGTFTTPLYFTVSLLFTIKQKWPITLVHVLKILHSLVRHNFSIFSPQISRCICNNKIFWTGYMHSTATYTGTFPGLVDHSVLNKMLYKTAAPTDHKLHFLQQPVQNLHLVRSRFHENHRIINHSYCISSQWCVGHIYSERFLNVDD